LVIGIQLMMGQSTLVVAKTNTTIPLQPWCLIDLFYYLPMQWVKRDPTLHFLLALVHFPINTSFPFKKLPFNHWKEKPRYINEEKIKTSEMILLHEHKSCEIQHKKLFSATSHSFLMSIPTFQTTNIYIWICDVKWLLNCCWKD